MKTSRNLYIVSLIMTLGITMPVSVFAGELKDAMQDLREQKQEIREEKKSLLQMITNRFANAKKAIIIGGSVTATTDSMLTVEKDGTSYTVNIGNKTQLRRRFWGKSEISEFSIGNIVNVYGTWTDDTQTAINARMIRNISIQKRFGVFVGLVKSLVSDGWVMSTISLKRADQAVTVSSETEFVNRRGETINQTDVKIGDRVRVKGLWDMSANTITEVTHVKDYNIPARVETSITPTATATLTRTATPTP